MGESIRPPPWRDMPSGVFVEKVAPLIFIYGVVTSGRWYNASLELKRGVPCVLLFRWNL